MGFAFTVAGVGASGQTELSARLRAFTGAPARLVWIRQVEGNGNDPFCWGSKLVVMGLDTEDGRGEREVAGTVANYHRPLLVPNGNQVVFSRIQTREAFVVDWDGGEPRRLGEGYAAAVWQDPASGIAWAYLADNGREGWDRHHAQALYRVRIDNPSVRELVWKHATFTIDNLQLSADGTRACAQFPHPRAGFADFKKQSWTPLGRGCWTSMAPDNSYLVWIFDGPHRNISIHDPTAATSWHVPINTAPGMDGFEVYHPRWSNHRRFFAITGPYKQGRAGDNLIPAGGPDVNVWIGKFAGDLKTVEGWQQATDNHSGNFYPDLWIRQGKSGPARGSAVIEGAGQAKALVPYAPAPGLVALWENASAANDAGGRRWDAVSRGRAFWGPSGEMELDGGFFRIVAEGGLGEDPGNDRREMTMEIRVHPLQIDNGTQATIAINPGKSAMGWGLEQIGKRLQFRFPGGEGQGEVVFDLGEAVAGRPVHLLVACGNGMLSAWRDGVPVIRRAEMPGRWTWSPRELLIGRAGTADLSSAWKGRADGFALYDRVLTDEEIATRWGQVRKQLAARTDPPEYAVVARLGEALDPPSAASILPYRRALLAQVFKVESAPAGSALSPGDDIAVAHWTVLDGEVQSRAFKSGQRYRLRITPFKDRPPLESERIFLDADYVFLPFFYEITGTRDL